MTTITCNDVAKRIRVEAARRNLNASELAKGVGISRNAMQEIFHGRNFPRAQTLASLAQKLNVTTDYLLGIDNERALIAMRGQQSWATVAYDPAVC